MKERLKHLTHRNEHLRQQRILHNWRLHDVAEQLGTTITTVKRWERGNQQPGAYYRTRLCILFGLSSQELGFGEAILSESYSSAMASSILTSSEKIALWTVPYARNPTFTGRDAQLTRLTQQFSPSTPERPTLKRRTALTPALAITGLGGIGKTQIAVEYAYLACEQGRYTHTLWINAASKETILSSFVSIAALLPDSHIQHQTDQRQRISATLRWLEQCEQPWLLIFDNADELSFVQPYLPRQGNGCILLTTRASAASMPTSSLDMDNMSVQEGTLFLLRRTQRLGSASPDEIEEARRIVIALAQFPLALDQAGAYIEETGCSFSTYLHLYHSYRPSLLARRGTQAIHHPDTVATTWSLSLQKMARTNPATSQFLRLCAFLAADCIPEELLVEGATYWPPALQQVVTDPFAFNQMVQDLLTFSLLKRRTRDRMLSVHPLMQVVQMDQMAPEEQRQWAERVVRVVHAAFPRNPRDEASWSQCVRYLEQVEMCATLIQQHHLWLPEAVEMLDRAGIYLRECVLYERASLARSKALGSAHSRAADTRKRLTAHLRQIGRIQEAEVEEASC